MRNAGEVAFSLCPPDVADVEYAMTDRGAGGRYRLRRRGRNGVRSGTGVEGDLQTMPSMDLLPRYAKS